MNIHHLRFVISPLPKVKEHEYEVFRGRVAFCIRMIT